MTTATIFTRGSAGLAAPAVAIQVHITNGLPAFTVVGLPESTVRESRERVRSALLNSFFEWPDSRITVNLAPADLPKAGGRYDLPIALGLLVASGQLPQGRLDNWECFGELGLDGSVRPCTGLLGGVIAATSEQRQCLVPLTQAPQLARVPDSVIVGAGDLLSACALIRAPIAPPAVPSRDSKETPDYPDLADVQGQGFARRAIEVAAAGGHHLLLSGPPGAGKSLLAACLPGLLPPPHRRQQLEIMQINDLMGDPPLAIRPFRAPHHSASPAALIGGGANARPGEVSRAHGGVLFLDELAEFPRAVLDTLRQPLESGQVLVSRVRGHHWYPASFQLVAAMNPCPCGNAGASGLTCRCGQDTIQRYQAKVSGPLLDRIDLHVTLQRQTAENLLHTGTTNESSDQVARRVSQARDRQIERQGRINANLETAKVMSSSALDAATQRWFERAADKLHMSARGIHRCLRVARTVADLEDAPTVEQSALLEALNYRAMPVVGQRVGDSP